MDNVIVLCPCCATPQDAQARLDEHQDLECPACGQGWSMVVDADRIAEHALT